MAALRFNTFLLLLSLLLIMPFSNYGMVDGFQGGMEAKYFSLEQGGNIGIIQMSSSRKLLMGAMLDYDDAGANTKHDHEPKKKPGKP